MSEKKYDLHVARESNIIATPAQLKFTSAETDFNKEGGRFYVFAYSLDMDAENVKVYNPQAQVRAVACLRNYRLVFKRYSNRYQGSLASVDALDGESVWGVVWEQNGTSLRGYESEGFSILAYVEVETVEGHRIVCRTPQIVEAPTVKRSTEEERGLVERSRLPSRTYMMYIAIAARNMHLPIPYVTELESMETNKVTVVKWTTGPIEVTKYYPDNVKNAIEKDKNRKEDKDKKYF